MRQYNDRHQLLVTTLSCRNPCGSDDSVWLAILTWCKSTTVQVNWLRCLCNFVSQTSNYLATNWGLLPSGCRKLTWLVLADIHCTVLWLVFTPAFIDHVTSQTLCIDLTSVKDRFSNKAVISFQLKNNVNDNMHL